MFNGIRLTDYLNIIDIRGRGLADQSLDLIKPPGSDKSYISHKQQPTRYLEIDYEVRGKNQFELRKNIDIVSGLIKTKQNVEVIFDDETDMIYYCEFAGSEEGKEFHYVGIHRGTIKLLRDPYKYGSEEGYNLSDATTITNEGTAGAEPIFELTATQKATFAMVSIEDEEYNLIGKPAEVDEIIVNEKTELLVERGDTISEWTSVGTQTDSASSKVQGTFGVDGTGIIATSYGPSHSGWHGPALMKEITPTQDFEVEMRLRAQTTNANQVYRIEFYLYDVNMNVLGKMAIWDSSDKQTRIAAEGRFGPFVGTRVNYPLMARNYLLEEKHFHGMIRMRRRGQKFEFYVARTTRGEGETGRHWGQQTETYIDADNQYQGKLKYVQISMGKYGSKPGVSLPRINNMKVSKYNTVLVDQTPYIVNVGDKIMFDHKTEDILINGEPENQLKDFGAEFFKLKNGINNIVILPENTFDSTVRFNKRSL